MSNSKIKVLISGAFGRMGQAVIDAVNSEDDLEIVALVDVIDDIDAKAKNILGEKAEKITLSKDLKNAIDLSKPDVAVDFTNPSLVYKHTKCLVENGVRPVIGTTGLSPDQLNELIKKSSEKKLGGLIAPNFAIGAVLMMQFAKKASQYFEHAEIVELHHNKKLDAPSGTAIKTAELMEEEQSKFGTTNIQDKELIQGARGAVTEKNIHIHSVRLPGLIAHQEVYLAGPGQLLTIRHDSFDRASFMPGVILAVKKVMLENKMLYGLENLL